ncbi:MAG: 4-hydroxythreonine-4-phosphate dehydrogenase PdxA [Halocynthiibacter sp.]
MTHAAPLILTCGDPSGIGPEIAVRAWQTRQTAPFVYLGDPTHLPENACFEVITTPRDAHDIWPRAMPVLAHTFNAPAPKGQPDPRNAQGVIDVIARAVSLVQSGEASGLCTNPIHKKELQDHAGFAYPGHTEFLAHLGGDVDVVMMLASDVLRVVPATIHIPLCEVAQTLTRTGLRAVIETTHQGLIDNFGINAPRIAIAGLNPHAGEGGKMGTEENDMIAPLIAELAQTGMKITGPHSADTMFHDRARTSYDAAICMYHDQALIPIKTLAFDSGVNVTLGLPFIRTSPDHGTAFDIAGQGIARADSLIAALNMAADMAERTGG